MQDNNTSVAIDVYALVTNKIIEFLEAGTIPWRKPWHDAGIPRNLISKRPYRGINVVLLNALPYKHNLFLTWKQIKTLGASVLRGEKGSIVVFNKVMEKKIETDGTTGVQIQSIMRYYKVFNVAQCKDIPPGLIAASEHTNIVPLESCARIVAGMHDCPLIHHEGYDAYYEPVQDYINIPEISSFDSYMDYYSTLFHELIHSTGHQKRVGRKELYETPHFGSEKYSMEELVAEMGSCYLKSHSGIPIETLTNSAAYIQGWLQVFKGDNRFVIYAASKAQQAVEFILNTLQEELKDQAAT